MGVGGIQQRQRGRPESDPQNLTVFMVTFSLTCKNFITFCIELNPKIAQHKIKSFMASYVIVNCAIV